MRMIEKRVKVAVGLCDVARKLNVSRGHLSLVVHGKRTSRRLVARLIAECGWKPGGTLIIERGAGRVKARAV